MADYSCGLPDRLNLEILDQLVERLHIDVRNQGRSAIEFVVRYASDDSKSDATKGEFEILDAQRVVAVSNGFASWDHLQEHVLLQAIKNGDEDGLRASLRHASDVAKILTAKIMDESPTSHAFGTHATLLQFASFRDWKGSTIAPVLIEHGATIDLHSACGLGQVDRIHELVGQDRSRLEEQVDTYFPLQYAIAARRPDAVRALMELGDAPNRAVRKLGWYAWENRAVELCSPIWRPIHMASIWGHRAGVPIVTALYEAGADLTADSPLDGYRPIHLAASQNLADLIRYLVANGVDVDSRTTDRNYIVIPEETMPIPHGGSDWTPLMVTAGEGFIETAECLVELGTDVHAKNSLGRTALHIAAGGFWGEREDIYARIAGLLVEHGADKEAVDCDGRRPVDFARMKNYDTIVELLDG